MTSRSESNGGLMVLPSPVTLLHRELIIALAVRHRLPAVYPFRSFTVTGGLMSYGIDPTDQFRQAAGYVDRILKGEKPADLPVQAPTKFELVDQSQDRQGAWPHAAAISPRPRRRGDRIRTRFAAVLMAADWHIAANRTGRELVAFGGIADIGAAVGPAWPGRD